MTNPRIPKSIPFNENYVFDREAKEVSWTPENIAPAIQAILFDARNYLIRNRIDRFSADILFVRKSSFSGQETIDIIEQMLRISEG